MATVREPGPAGPNVVPYAWLHMNDNVIDPFHVQVLHTTFSGTQFVREFEVMPWCGTTRSTRE